MKYHFTRDLFAAWCALMLFSGHSAIADPAATAAPADAPLLPVVVSPTDPHIRYVGRFDFRTPAGPRCAWSASRVEMRFTGSALNVALSDTGDDAYEVVVDGKPVSILTAQPGKAVYAVMRDGKAAAHTVSLVKRTEPMVGTTQFLAFQLSAGGRLLPLPAASTRRLQVIGDSISCGYGDEAADQNQHFSPATENAYLSYGAIAARAVHAEYACVAWSGRKMWPDNTVPEIYGLALPTDPASTWDYAQWVPDAVVINLATNDFGVSNPDRAAWTAAYERFVARVRGYYPKAAIYCATGPMMSDNWPVGHQALTTLNSYMADILKAERDAGDPNVHLLTFAPQTPDNGFGADYHPSLKTQDIMGETLAKTLATDLGWSKQTAPAAP